MDKQTIKDAIIKAIYSGQSIKDWYQFVNIEDYPPETITALLDKTYELMETLMTKGYLDDTSPYTNDSGELFIRPSILKQQFIGMARPKIICAANVITHSALIDGYVIVATPRHGCAFMNQHMKALRDIDELFSEVDNKSTIKFNYQERQGFIDQFGNYYTRSKALELMRFNGQPFHLKRNGSVDILFSEGIY